MKKLLLNCDLGEGESTAGTRALMREIDLASVACGGHAGDVVSMEACARLAAEHGVKLGAHPGSLDRAGRGRGPGKITSKALALLLVQQVAALETVARRADVPLHHVKLHGSLYHLTESSTALRRTYLETMRRYWPNLTVVALANGKVQAEAKQFGLETLAEAFADRAYDQHGRLLPRATPGAMIENARDIQARLRSFVQTNTLTAINGRLIHLEADTVCVHSDTAGSLRLVKAVRRALRN